MRSRGSLSTMNVQTDRSPVDAVDAQLAAYNRRDLDAYCAQFSQDASLSRLDNGEDICRGQTDIRRYYAQRFRDNPNLHCEIIKRTFLGAFVIDYERVEGFENSVVEVIAIYEVGDGLISSVRFIWP